MNTAFVPEDYFAQYGVADIFGAGDTCEVDLGCGDGGFLLAMAEHYPETRFLGVERLLGRIRKVCNESARRGLDNVRGLRVESRYFLEWMVAPGSISRLHYLFPDPWPKEKHHKNRLVQDSFIPVLHRALAPGGEVLFKTDHEAPSSRLEARRAETSFAESRPMKPHPTLKLTRWQKPYPLL